MGKISERCDAEWRKLFALSNAAKPPRSRSPTGSQGYSGIFKDMPAIIGAMAARWPLSCFACHAYAASFSAASQA